MKKYAPMVVCLMVLSLQAREFTKKKMSLKNRLVSLVAAEITTLPVTAILAALSWTKYKTAKINYVKYLKFEGLSKNVQSADSWVDCIDIAHGYQGDALFDYTMYGVFSVLALTSAIYVPYWLYKKNKEEFWTRDYNMLVDCLEEIQGNPLLLKDLAYQEKLAIPCKNLIAWKVKNWSFSETDTHDIVTILKEIQNYISAEHLADI